MVNDDWIFSLYVKEMCEKQHNVNNKGKLTEEDYYIENGNIVLTHKYHLNRGYCCNNNCINCPYK